MVAINWRYNGKNQLNSMNVKQRKIMSASNSNLVRSFEVSVMNFVIKFEVGKMKEVFRGLKIKFALKS